MKVQFRPIQSIFTLLILLGLFVTSALVVSPVLSAGTIHVNTFVDEDENNEFCSLREAIVAANSGNNYRGCTGATAGANTIILEEGTYSLSLNYHLWVNQEMSVVGKGATETIIQASACDPTSNGCNHDHRIFLVFFNGQLTLSEMTLRHGIGTNGFGGAINNFGNLTIEKSTLSANWALSGSGIYNSQSSSVLVLDDTLITGNTAANYGGGIYVETCETITVKGNTKISGNSAGILGGGIYHGNCELTINNSEISGNSAVNGGGGIHNLGLLTQVEGTNVINNTTGGNGAGIRNLGDITLSDSELEGNTADFAGGGIFNTGSVELNNTNIANNYAQEKGAGIYSSRTLSMTGGIIKENTAKQYGGGIYIIGLGSAIPANTTLTNVTVSDNHTEEGSGGGIYNSGYSTLTMYGSTVERNTADFEGGGVYNDIIGSDSVFVNSTFSGNAAEVNGGAISNRNSNLQLTHCTIYENTAAGTGGGVYNQGSSSELRIRNTIIAQSTNLDCDNQSSAVMENTASLVQSHHGCLDPHSASDPMLSVLGDYGGPTHTHALQPHSPAVDAASLDFCEDFDQRGVERPQGVGCDIGAFELEQNTFIFLPLILR